MFTPRPENVELSLYEPYGCYSYGCQLDLAIPWSGVWMRVVGKGTWKEREVGQF